MSIAYDKDFFNSTRQFSLTSTIPAGSLVKLVKDVFMWCGDTVNKGDVKPISYGLNGVIVDSNGAGFGFHEHARVQFETGDIGYVPTRWLVEI